MLSPEEQLLTDFFEASRLHDTTAAARFSSVPFNPRDNGVVQEFQVERIDRANDGQSKIVTVLAQARDFAGNESSRRLALRLARQKDRWFITEIHGGP